MSKLHTWLWELNRLVERKEGQLEQLSSSTVYVGLVVGLILGLFGFAALMLVDYTILKEFWAGFQTDDLGQSRLSGSEILFKSLQVLAAATIFHFFYTSLSPNGKRVYTRWMFGAVLILLVAVGFLYSFTSMPEGTTIGGVELKESRVVEDTTLRDLGLQPVDPQAGSAVEEEPSGFVQTVTSVVRGLEFFSYVALVVIFVAVTSAAVMMLHIALRSGKGLFGASDDEAYENVRADAAGPKAMKIRVERFLERYAADDATGLRNRESFLLACLNHFKQGYFTGANSRRGLFGNGSGKKQRLDEAMKKAETAIPLLVRGEPTSHLTQDNEPGEERAWPRAAAIFPWR